MRKCALLVVSLTIMGFCAFVLPDLLGWSAHRYHADQVRQVLAPSLPLPDGKERSGPLERSMKQGNASPCSQRG